jgi:hypothetical protein
MNPQDPRNDDRELNPSGKPPLSEKDFIQNGWSITSIPFWLSISLAAIVIALILGSRGWYEGFMQKEKMHDPFLEVTNRDFSVFLWQFPSFMRVNVSKKTGYLPGFLSTGENFNTATAEEFVSAPPDLIFLYHTWNRLLSPEFIARSIKPSEFDDFLQHLPEWQPLNWKNAPQEYVKLIDSKNYSKMDDLQTLPESVLPLIVRQAFQGWKNYFFEGPKINEVHPTFVQVETFLKLHPNYARNFWRNIETVHDQEVAGSNYLYALMNGTFIPDAEVPKEQLAPFLKLGLFNAEQARDSH